MGKNNRTRNVASFVRPGDHGVRLHLPNGKSIRFNTVDQAQSYIDINYPDRSLERYTGKQRTEPQSPPKKVHYASEDLPTYIDSGRKGINRLIGSAAPSPEFTKAYNRIGMDPIFNDVRVENMRRAWKNNPEYMQYAWTDTGNQVGAVATLPILGMAYEASPLVAGAMNLYGAYEGLDRLTSDEGVAKTWNKFSQGDWKGGLQSLGGDAFDVAMSLPFLNRMRQGVTMAGNTVRNGGRALAGNYVAKQFTRMSPYYDFSFDWRTGKFNLTPKPGMSGAATSVAKADMLPGQVRELPGTPRALGAAESGAAEVPSVRTYGSMNEVADALEAGEFPANSQMEAIAPQVVEPSTVTPTVIARTRSALPPMNEFGHYGDPSSLTTEQLQAVIDYTLETDSLPSEVLGHYINELRARQGMQEVTQSLDDLPPAPAEVNNVTGFENNSFESGNPFSGSFPQVGNVEAVHPTVEEFDWGEFESTPAAAPPIGPYDELLRGSRYIRNQNGTWTHALDGGTFTFGDDGVATFSPGRIMPSIQLQPNEIENFIRTRNDRTFNLDGPFRSLNDFIIRNQYPLGDVGSFGNLWRINYTHPSGVQLPIRLRQEPNGSIKMSLGNGEPTFISTTPETTAQEVYDGIMNYVRSVQIPELTPDQLSLIHSVFPNEVPPMRLGLGRQPGSRGFQNAARTRGLVYNPLDQTFSTRGLGYRRFRDEPIANLTPEALEPIKAPTIITSAEGLPAFSRISSGTNWGTALGVDPGFNPQIDFGLQRPRPTADQVRKALGIQEGGISSSQGDAHFYIERYSPNYTENMPLIETPYEVPILHLNMVPSDGGKLAAADKRWLGQQMESLSENAKGVDIASTGDINPTVSRFVSDLQAATNLSDLDKYNILKMFLENPGQFYREHFNNGDYSPFSWYNNAIRGGKKPKKFFTEPSRNTYTGSFNNYGNQLESPIKGLFNMNPSQLGYESPGISLNANNSTLLQNWMKENIPYLYTLPQDRTKVPFPVTTFRKKGGRLVKKKIINGKKTCK